MANANIVETWKPIREWENLYEISSYGRIRSLDRIVFYNGVCKHVFKGVMKTPSMNRRGYLTIGLYDKKRYKRATIHRLVAEAFIPNPNNLPMINHKDEDKTNNHISNLEWCDAKYNCNYGTRNQRGSLKRYKSVAMMDDDGNILNTFKSLKEASEKTGINKSSICENIYKSRRVYHAGGYKWKYINQ